VGEARVRGGERGEDKDWHGSSGVHWAARSWNSPHHPDEGTQGQTAIGAVPSSSSTIAGAGA
jgi:hypothetical protein